MTLSTIHTLVQAMSPEIHVVTLTAHPLDWPAFGLTHLGK